MDPEAAAVVCPPAAALRAFETVYEERSPGLVHAEALTRVVRIGVRGLLCRQQGPLFLRLPSKSTNRDICEFILHAPSVHGCVPTALLLFLLVAGTRTSAKTHAVVPARGVKGGAEPVIQLSRVLRELVVGAAHAAPLVLHKVHELVLVSHVLSPLLEGVTVLSHCLCRHLSVVGNHRAAKDVNGRVDTATLLALLALLLAGIAQRLLPLLLGEPRVCGLRIPIRGIVEDPCSSLCVPVVAEQPVFRGLRLLEGFIELDLLLAGLPG
mmetsp:Transcript_57481/g.159083  ORF Transcript_57481/g.159083 Transcript_57481/m.159083 type:complete len:267 (-) Transcript_57481:67-867(-)